MGVFLPILLELLTLAFLLFLYYLWQRKRIIKHDKIEIKMIVHEMLDQLNEYQKSANNEDNEIIKTYCTEVQKHLESSQYKKLAHIIKNPPKCIPKELRYDSESLFEKIMFHGRKQ